MPRISVARVLVCLLACALLTPAAAQPASLAAPNAAAPFNRGSITRVPPPRPASPRLGPRATAGDRIDTIRVEGNQRIESGTILSYMLLQPGDPFDPDRMNNSLKTLYATGLFQDVNLSRQGNTLVVKVVENPLVNRVAFEGNHKLTEDQLKQIVQLRPRSVFTPAAAEADRQRILARYAAAARFDATVEPQIIRLDQNRVDVVFKISEGATTLVSRIAIVGNHAFSESRLQDVISSREQAWFRFLSTSDEYDPQRVNFDKEQLRRFYLKQGYADIDVVDATAELSPDRKAFFLTYTVHEGERYRVNKIAINSQVPKVPAASLRPDLQIAEGDWYDGDAVGRSADAMESDVHSRGIPFIAVTPRVERNVAKHTIDLSFDVAEGPRVYVERIDIVGNTRTEDKVIRREFRLAEGDAYNAELVRRSRQRLQDLNYFNSVNIQSTPGSSPDKAILTTTVDEKATGELTIGGGYSTDSGALLDAGLREHNFLGTGIDAGLEGVLAQRNSSIDLTVTDPYFLDRNLVASTSVFLVQTNNLDVAQYDEKRVGFATSLGYDFNEHLRQALTYTLVGRTVYNVATDASFYVQNSAGYTLLSQVSQLTTIDYRDSRIEPHTGYTIAGGTDFAGIGGNAKFVRARINGTYYIPLDRFTGNSDWGFAISAGTGYLFNLGQQEQIIDRFFLGGDNLRGFETGGAGPHDPTTGDALGGRFIWTQSTEFHYPLPVSPDLGLSGRAFVDVGGLTEGNFENNSCPTAAGGVCPPVFQSAAPRVGIGVGVAWHTGFGLINIDLTPFVIKQPHDQTQIFRFGFGTSF